MKNFILLFLFTTASISLEAQSSIGIHFSFGKSYSMGSLRATSMEANYSIAPGFDYQYQLKPSLSIMGSLGLQTLSEKYVDDNLRWGSEHNSEGGFVVDNSLPHQLVRTNYLFLLNTQLGLKIYLAKDKINFFLQPYIEGNFLLSQRQTTTTYYDDGRIYSSKSDSDLQAYNQDFLFGTGLGFGAEINLGKKFSLYLMPEAKLIFGGVASYNLGKTFIPGVRLGMWYNL